MRILLLALCFIVGLQAQVKVFGMNPQISVILELLCSECMIGLNYKPYQEDLEFMPKSLHHLPILGGLMANKEVSFEKLISLKPDIIFFPKGVDSLILNKYQALGIKVVSIDSNNITKEDILKIARYLQQEQKGHKLVALMQRSEDLLKKARAKIQQVPNIYFAQGYDGLKTQCHTQDDLASLLGAKNIISCKKNLNLSQINFEVLLQNEIDAIFVRELSLYQTLKNNPPKLWQQIKAIRDKKIYYAPSTPSNWLMRPISIMQTLGLVWGFSKLHPELISEKQVEEFVFEFFQTFLQPLSKEAYQKIQG